MKKVECFIHSECNFCSILELVNGSKRRIIANSVKTDRTLYFTLSHRGLLIYPEF